MLAPQRCSSMQANRVEIKRGARTDGVVERKREHRGVGLGTHSDYLQEPTFRWNSRSRPRVAKGPVCNRPESIRKRNPIISGIFESQAIVNAHRVSGKIISSYHHLGLSGGREKPQCQEGGGNEMLQCFAYVDLVFLLRCNVGDS